MVLLRWGEYSNEYDLTGEPFAGDMEVTNEVEDENLSLFYL